MPQLQSSAKPSQKAKCSQEASEQRPEQSGKGHGKEIVGLRCKVFWADDKTWYKGDITQHDASKGKHLVEYEDGETEWLDLSQEKFELLQKSGVSLDPQNHMLWHHIKN